MSARTTAFVSTYPPRLCGIATFTRDLSHAIAAADRKVGTTILAMTDQAESAADLRAFPDSVRFKIRRGVKDDYVSAADFVNYSDIRLVSIQHEYGIFGGDDGVHILDFLARLRIPSIATLHTVLESPSRLQRTIVEEMAQRCGRLVVMSRIGVRLLAQSYDVPAEKVVMIPHGIPDLPRDDIAQHKKQVGAAGRRLLLTFGLLSPNKGIETVIRALPQLAKRFPDLLFFVIGATHPEVKRRHGEEYRHSLEREAHALGVADHVVFRNQFVTFDELCGYLQAADIYVTSYKNEAQSTSGALAYAMGAGAAVVSTPYWHAQELLADGRGRLFPIGDVDAFAQTIDSLFSNESELQTMRAAAYAFTRPMTWARVGEAYATLAEEVLHEAVPRRSTVPGSVPARESSLPELRLDHLLRLTDDTGIIQHATFSVPARRTGYCVDDNARALLVALLAHRVTGSLDARRLITVYLSFLHYCQHENGQFHNFVDYNRVVETDIGSQDCIGRALWALGATVHIAPDEGTRRLARGMFDRAITQALEFGPRGQALAIMGLDAILRVEPDNAGFRATLDALAANLCQRFEHEADTHWQWFEPMLTYDNAIIPLALFTAFKITGDRKHLRVATESLRFLEEVCFDAGRLTLIGNRGWHQRGERGREGGDGGEDGAGDKPAADEQPIDATAFVLAFRGAYLATGERRYLKRMRESFDWFLGANRLNIRMYDFSTAGCRDGLGIHESSQNQGAESTVSFLMALLTMLDIGGRGISGGQREVLQEAREEPHKRGKGTVEVVIKQKPKPVFHP
ncbi:MAG: glycosyltransferase [Phycisphaerales bacterium]|nr:MAG: glycosyltransferase [Phycisphaerales bacterium]